MDTTDTYTSACFIRWHFLIALRQHLTMQQLNSSNSSLTTSFSTENLIASSVLSVCFILGVPANIAVMVRLAGWLKRGSFTPRLMLSLAVSDLLTLLSLPVWIWALLHGWVFSLVLCKLLSYLVYLSLYCSMLCVILMSVQRYIQVLHPQKWNKLGRKGKKILVSGIWILSGVLSSYALVQRTLSLDREGHLQCRLHYQNDVERVATLIWEIILFVVLFPTLTYFYFHLSRGVNNSAFFSSRSLTKLVTRIIACFFILWVPLQISNIVIITAALLRNDSLLRSAERSETITAALTFINSCMNPFLYGFSARAVRQQTDGTENT
ncbi:C5a anaphylatoxin chemotactic receptor 1-like [Pangasianodon hypophthalmus]|uniref:C5a anaphylatoxin chemotactic receptor 1-like n=1 Tax=Pangasianodon hypophthalmus TaxID=310915 RepID=UPI002307D9D8|nr:C5a anaphylatoxin chemotactic receptor 1-like [Pangasianodon hypophthalmus]